MTERLPKKFVYSFAAAAVTVILVMIVSDLFVLAPQRKGIRAIDQRIKELEQTMVNPQAGNSDINKLKLQLSKSGQTLSQFVVGSEQAADLAVNINNIAKQVGLQEIRSTNRMQSSYGSINECQYVREGRIQLNFKSSFPQFAQFINSLERNQPVIFVDYFKINRSAAGAALNEVEMVLTFFVGQDSLKNIIEPGNSTGGQKALTKNLN